MIRYLKQLIEDWVDFRMIRTKFDVLNPLENEELIRYIVNRYSEKNEEELNAVLLHSLARDLVKGTINPDTYRGFVLALEYRLSLFRNHRKLLHPIKK